MSELDPNRCFCQSHALEMLVIASVRVLIFSLKTHNNEFFGFVVLNLLLWHFLMMGAFIDIIRPRNRIYEYFFI